MNKISGVDTEEVGVISGKREMKMIKSRCGGVQAEERDEMAEKKQNSFLGENWSTLVSF